MYESEWNTIDWVGLNTRRQDVKSPCEMKTDLVLWYGQFPYDIPSPCPDLYVPIADLRLQKQESIMDSYIRVFARYDINYAEEIGSYLLRGWPEPYARPFDWLARYWKRVNPVLAPL